MPRPSLEGVRTHIILTKHQDRELRKLADKTGLTSSEHVRRAVDFYLSKVGERLSTQKR